MATGWGLVWCLWCRVGDVRERASPTVSMARLRLGTRNGVVLRGGGGGERRAGGREDGGDVGGVVSGVVGLLVCRRVEQRSSGTCCK